MSAPNGPRICPRCGQPYAGTYWHETGACLIACGDLIEQLRRDLDAALARARAAEERRGS